MARPIFDEVTPSSVEYGTLISGDTFTEHPGDPISKSWKKTDWKTPGSTLAVREADGYTELFGNDKPVYPIAIMISPASSSEEESRYSELLKLFRSTDAAKIQFLKERNQFKKDLDEVNAYLTQAKARLKEASAKCDDAIKGRNEYCEERNQLRDELKKAKEELRRSEIQRKHWNDGYEKVAEERDEENGRADFLKSRALAYRKETISSQTALGEYFCRSSHINAAVGDLNIYKTPVEAYEAYDRHAGLPPIPEGY